MLIEVVRKLDMVSIRERTQQLIVSKQDLCKALQGRTCCKCSKVHQIDQLTTGQGLDMDRATFKTIKEVQIFRVILLMASVE